MGREGSQMAHGLAVPIELVDVVDGGNQHGDIGRCTGSGGDVDAAAVPREAVIVGVAFCAPGLVDGDLFPSVMAGGVVDGGCGPGEVVAEVKLPGAVERD